MSEHPEIERLLARLETGDESARSELFELVYAELHALATREMASQRASHTLQPTALVHEAYLKLSGKDQWVDRRHFMRLSASAMRQVLVDHARRRATDKRAQPGARVELDTLLDEYDRRSGGLLEIDEALARLQAKDPELVKLVELRFFLGHTIEEAAAILDLPVRSAARRWRAARLFLRGELER